MFSATREVAWNAAEIIASSVRAAWPDPPAAAFAHVPAADDGVDDAAAAAAAAGGGGAAGSAAARE